MDANIEGNRRLLTSRYAKMWIDGARGWQMVVIIDHRLEAAVFPVR
jgi:hypothetical protein